jgi:hypothetical protein
VLPEVSSNRWGLVLKSQLKVLSLLFENPVVEIEEEYLFLRNFGIKF